MNSVITLCVTVGRVFFDSLAGYALTRLHFAGRSLLAGLFIGIMAVPAVVLLIPKYLVLVQLGLFNSYAGMMARPAVITLTILSFQGSWNELPHFIISRQSPELNTLTSGVGHPGQRVVGAGTQFPLKMAAAL